MKAKKTRNSFMDPGAAWEASTAAKATIFSSRRESGRLASLCRRTASAVTSGSHRGWWILPLPGSRPRCGRAGGGDASGPGLPLRPFPFGIPQEVLGILVGGPQL